MPAPVVVVVVARVMDLSLASSGGRGSLVLLCAYVCAHLVQDRHWCDSMVLPPLFPLFFPSFRSTMAVFCRRAVVNRISRALVVVVVVVFDRVV